MTPRALVLIAFLLSGPALRAHHSAALFDLTKTLMFTGAITKVDWRNPHVVIFVDVKNDAGGVDAWAFETGAPSWFRARMIEKRDFETAIGQPLTIEAVRAKDGSLYGYVYRIVFATGNRLELR
jgi:hypothetical protein